MTVMDDVAHALEEFEEGLSEHEKENPGVHRRRAAVAINAYDEAILVELSEEEE